MHHVLFHMRDSPAVFEHSGYLYYLSITEHSEKDLLLDMVRNARKYAEGVGSARPWNGLSTCFGRLDHFITDFDLPFLDFSRNLNLMPAPSVKNNQWQTETTRPCFS